MQPSKRYSLNHNNIELYVKKSPLLVRGTFLVLAVLCIGLPLMGIGLNMAARTDFHIGYLIVLGIFSLFNFFFIRLFLWNSYGKEVIVIEDSKVTYYADYRYFKGNQKEISFETLRYDFVAKGFVEQQIGNLLLIAKDAIFIESAVDMPIGDLVEIIEALEMMGGAEKSLA